MKKFGEWVEGKSKKEIIEAMESHNLRLPPNAKEALPLYTLYYEEKLLGQNKMLVIATWALALVTIILAVITWLK